MQTGNLRIKQPVSPAVVTAGTSATTAMAVVENFAMFYGRNVRLMLGSFEIPLYSKHQIESKLCLSPHCFSTSNTLWVTVCQAPLKGP